MAHLQSNLSKMYFPSEKLRKLFDGQNMNDDHEAGNVSERQKGSEGIAQKTFLVTAETVTISQNTSLSRNITFLLGMAGTLPYLLAWLSHTWLGRTSTSALCPTSASSLQQQFYNFFFLITSNTTPQMSYFQAQENFSILSQHYFVVLYADTISPGFFLPPITMSPAEVTNLSSESRNKTTEPTESSFLFFTFHTATARLQHPCIHVHPGLGHQLISHEVGVV